MPQPVPANGQIRRPQGGSGLARSADYFYARVCAKHGPVPASAAALVPVLVNRSRRAHPGAVASDDQGAALEPVGRGDAVRLTEQLRAAIGEARRAAVVLAGRVREAHRARVWVALGYSGWGAYAEGELRISRAQAYRLIDIAESAEGLNRAIGAAGVLADVSPARETPTRALWWTWGCRSGHCARFTAGSMRSPRMSPSGSRPLPRPRS